MKYAIIIPDGAADDPLTQLGGRTPFEVAATPNMDAIARMGRQGLARTVPDGFESGSDVAIMTLLGYDPARYHTGRAPLEAAAQRIALSPTDWVFRCNLVTVVAGVMKDHSAGGISDIDARTLLKLLADDLKLDGFEFHPGVSYRNLLVYRGADAFDLKTKPPHEIPEQPVTDWVPQGIGSDVLNRIMARSAGLFRDHPIVLKHRSKGINAPTQVWLWGQGHAPAMPRFVDQFAIPTGCMITGVDLLRGLAVLLGWDVHEVAGMTSFHDTNYLQQGIDTCERLDQYDLVLSHIEAPDEASHQADYKTKIASIEAIDQFVVGPVLEKMRRFTDWRLLVMPDHPTNIATRKHGYAWPPFCLAGSDLLAAGGPTPAGGFTEANAAASGVRIERGHELMEYFLRGAR